MKLIIDIPEEEYELVRHGNKSYMTELILMNAVANGTPLPENHGDLVDRNRICKAIYAAEDNLTGSGMTYDEMDIYNDGINSMWNKLQNADPIIEADKESEE